MNRKIKAIILSAIVLTLSLIMVFNMKTSATYSETTFFGNTLIGNYYDVNDANAQSLSYFTYNIIVPGGVEDIIAYVAGTSAGNAIAAIYAMDGRNPTALLEQSASVQIGTSFSWVTFPLSTPVTLSTGSTYGLAIMGDVPLSVVVMPGTGEREHNAASSYAQGFSNPFGAIWGSNDAGAMCIYAANYEPPPTPTPTPSPTPIPTASPTPSPTPTPTPTTNPVTTQIKISANVTVTGTTFVKNSETSYTLNVTVQNFGTNDITVEIAKPMLPQPSYLTFNVSDDKTFAYTVIFKYVDEGSTWLITTM
jgi:hypothetical protein